MHFVIRACVVLQYFLLFPTWAPASSRCCIYCIKTSVFLIFLALVLFALRLIMMTSGSGKQMTPVIAEKPKEEGGEKRLMCYSGRGGGLLLFLSGCDRFSLRVALTVGGGLVIPSCFAVGDLWAAKCCALPFFLTPLRVDRIMPVESRQTFLTSLSSSNTLRQTVLGVNVTCARRARRHLRPKG